MTEQQGVCGTLGATSRRIFARAALAAHRTGRRLKSQGRAVAADLRNVPRYAARTLTGLVVAFGLLNLWDSRGDGPMPAMNPLEKLDPYRISSAGCVAAGTGAEARWRGLAPALAILDRVSPPVAAWVRGKHAAGALVFHDDYRNSGELTAALAKYDMFRGRLVVNRQLFCESDGAIAVVLCHEYRHSRQNCGKIGKYLLSFLFVEEGDPSIIENDALVFEQEARAAIFASGESKRLELAAWERLIRP